MQSIMGVTMRTLANKSTVLAVIIKNRDEHAEIVAEARKGYLDKAEELLKKKLEEVGRAKQVQGKRVGSLKVELAEPGDHTGDYNTIIRMLELHQDEMIELNADEVRQFLENKWDWMSNFLRTSSSYSGKASQLLGD